jgi:hypothetical protein
VDFGGRFNFAVQAGSAYAWYELEASGAGLMPLEFTAEAPFSLQQVEVIGGELLDPVVATGVSVTYSHALTPVVTAVDPRNGTAYGGTVVTLTGNGFGPAAEAEVSLNGYPCAVVACATGEDWCVSDATRVRCRTAARTDGIKPLALDLRFADRGLALRNATTRFRYLDRWSDPRTWQGSERPRAGDAVIIPEGQAIMLDVSADVYLVLVQGLLVFDHRDLSLDAHYIWVHGGELEIGREDEPHPARVTVTLKGDRWKSVEIPFIGAKVLAVSNEGGLGSLNSHNRVGRLDIHGQPHMNYAKLMLTAHNNSDRVLVDRVVDWQPGEKLVFMNPPEEATLLAVEGTTLVLERPLRNEHFTMVYDFPFDGYPASEWRTDIPSYVMTLWRGVRIQGDEESELRQFGCRTGAFFGGHYRVRNAEFFRCGQAGLLGGYPLHFHQMNKRLVDVFQSYVKNNAIHHSYQRAVTIHATDYTVVNDNVAFDVAGHVFFLEDGSEAYGVMDRNFVIGGRRMIFGLKDDLESAGLWGAGNMLVFWRGNIVSDATFGIRFKGGSRLGDLTDNTVISSGVGWGVESPIWGDCANPDFIYNFTCYNVSKCIKIATVGCPSIKYRNFRVIESGLPLWPAEGGVSDGWE